VPRYEYLNNLCTKYKLPIIILAHSKEKALLSICAQASAAFTASTASTAFFRITRSFFARDPVGGDSKEKALPRCAWLRVFFIHALMQVKPATL
jgi:hypothetical protein